MTTVNFPLVRAAVPTLATIERSAVVTTGVPVAVTAPRLGVTVDQGASPTFLEA